MRVWQVAFICLVVLSSGWVWAWRPREMPRVPGEIVVQYRSDNLATLQVDDGKAVGAGAAAVKRPASLEALDQKYRLIRSRPVLDTQSQERLRRQSELRRRFSLASDLFTLTSALSRLSTLAVLTFDSDAPVEEICAAYRVDPNVVAAEPNWIGTLFAAPSDPLYPQQALDFSRIGMEAAWGVQTGSPSVIVAVIDSGVDTHHADLTNVLAPGGYNFVDGNTAVFDDIGHGTRVAGIIGAQANNGKGIAGVAYGVRLLPLDVADMSGNVTLARAIAAVDYAVAHGADVINMSFGFYAKSALFEQACNNAYEAGAVLVASAGNENQCTSLVYPAGFDSVIGVAATNSDAGDDRAVFSNYNSPGVNLADLAAPGVTIFSTIPGSIYEGTMASGTSYASPMVAGVAALLRSRYPTQSAPAVRHHLLATAHPVGAWAGSGRLDAAAALISTPTPAVTIERVIIDDSKTYRAANDADGRLDAGERVVLKLQLKNTGADAINLTGTISKSDPEISAPDTAGGWGTVLSGISATNDANPFTSLTYTTAAPTVKRVPFWLSLTANGGAYHKTLDFKVETENAQRVNAASYFAPVTCTSNKTWEILGTQNFNAGLTIQPGTVVKLAQGVDLNINAGALTANGTSTSPILFTSLYNPQSAIRNPQSIGPRNEPIVLGAYQQVRYVSANTGSDTTGNGSAANPWKTIPYTLSQITDASASKKYALLVAEGRYAGATIQMKEHMDMYGGFEPAAWTRDIFTRVSLLDGENVRSVIYGANNTRFDGFVVTRGCAAYSGGGIDASGVSSTITNNVIAGNSAWGGSGGGIYCHQSSPTITNNVIAGNSTGYYGGGIYCWSGSPTIINNVISGNSTGGLGGGGGGIYCASGSPTISNNVISGNSAVYYGGGIRCNEGSPTITNNVIAGNSANSGGGIDISGGSPTITNNVISGNSAGGGGAGIGCDGSPIIKNTIIYGNNGGQIDGGSPVVTYCDVQSGYSGAANINSDPKFSDDRLWSVADRIVYDGEECQTLLTDSSRQPFGPTNCLRGRIVPLWPAQGGPRYFVIACNSGNTMTVWGDATNGGAIKAPQPYEVLRTYHLSSSSPCIDAGTNTGAPATDMDGDPRPINGGHALRADMGADEYDPAKPSRQCIWGEIFIKADAVNSSMRYCTVENGQGVLNESASSGFSNCTFRNNTGWGLRSTAGTAALNALTAINNQGGGISAPTRNMTNCVANYGSGKGLVGASLSNCSAYANTSPTVTGNYGDGLTGSSAIGCTATLNGGIGLKISGTLTNCTARDNRGDGIHGAATGCSSSNNDGVGIVGSASNCDAFGNEGGGVSGNAANSRVMDNIGIGVSGSTAITNCEIVGNTGASVSGAQTLSGCIIVDNGSGVSGAARVSACYIATNSGNGVSGGAVSSSTIIGNTGKGIYAPGSVSNCFVMYNRGIGIDAPAGNVTYSAIRSNGGYGASNLASAKLLNYCNLFGNNLYEYYDDKNDASGGWPANRKDCRFNYWGPATAAQMTAHPFPSVNISRIWDLFDNGLAHGWYANYGGAGEFRTSSVPNAPNSAPPAFLFSVVPDMSRPLGVGQATFDLTFSKAMNTAIQPAVTFGATTPFTRNAVVPNPGWLNTRTWRGKFSISGETGNGVNTLRLSQATDASGFVIPDDTAHQFIVDSGRLGANNGLATALGRSSVLCEWSWQSGPPANLRGYNLVRSSSGWEGPYDELVNPSLLTTQWAVDIGLQSSTRYYYEVFWVDTSYTSTQMTPPFGDKTLGDETGAGRWTLYR